MHPSTEWNIYSGTPSYLDFNSNPVSLGCLPSASLGFRMNRRVTLSNALSQELTLIGLDLISKGLPPYRKINPNPLKIRLLTHVQTQI